MRKLTSFTFISLNGFYKGLHEDISWHQHGEEENQYSVDSLKSGNVLLFGRTTYEMMSGFWPSPMAAEMYPQVAAGMNKAEKKVFSNTLRSAAWHNTTIISGNVLERITKLKETPGSDLSILGSGSIVSQFTDANLIDTYEIMIDPIAIGQGEQLFGGIKQNLNLKLVSTKVFKSGVVLLIYERKR